MKNITLIALFLVMLIGCASEPQQRGQTGAKSSVTSSQNKGFFDFRWDESQGKIYLHVDKLQSPFIYQTSLARGIGSNDIGADRGRLGDTKLVEFYRSGSKLLLIENNMAFRAESDNVDEQNAVAESFARSVIWGFVIDEIVGDTLIVDATDFLLRDSLSLAQWLSEMEQGSYSVDSSRSAIFMPRTKAFEDNTEFEAMLTLTGVPTGELLSTVVPDTTAITVHTHHSFVRLPDDGYEPLNFDPRAGYIDPAYGSRYLDYASPISEPLAKSYTRRHRLEKKDPGAAVSEALEPIVYYLDRGAPEPMRSALLEGARWWNQAFEAAGYKDAFQIKLLPPDADPLDVRYNIIQWVHRSTRGWSYGSSVLDPRTGEIIKGHVSLGSLRVRQDYLLAEGLLAPYADQTDNSAMEEFSLARIRQLSAHEVGHTLGLEHNFAGSVNDRASVMDYPFPLITLTENGSIDIRDAYAEGIGEWDKRAITWGYQDYASGVNAQQAREKYLMETYRSGLKFVADVDARHVGSVNIDGNLWDNGADPTDELKRLMAIRSRVLANFSANNIQHDRPMATLEEVLVPMYLLHRYQLQAAGKVLGGGYYRYNLKGDGQQGFQYATANRQRVALEQLLATVTPEALQLPGSIVQLISPRPPGYSLGREAFDRKTRQLFDQFAPADAAIALTLDVLLEPSRGERLAALDATNFGFGLSVVLDELLKTSIRGRLGSGAAAEIQRRLNTQVIERLSSLVNSDSATPQVRAAVLTALKSANNSVSRMTSSGTSLWQAHGALLQRQIAAVLEGPQEVRPVITINPPPGSPIGN